MFQRIKGAIDSRIAEEQARQRLSQTSPSRSNTNTPRTASRAISPPKRNPRQASRGRQDGDSTGKGPDPADFEPEFVVEDDEPSRSGTPRPPTDRNGAGATEKSAQATAAREGSQETSGIVTSSEEHITSSDLPTDVRVKLRKLDKLESRYHELLRSYRVAHSRVLTIEPFEASLRENTPLTSISDPKALVEYLNQINLKGDMVLGELKRVSNERDNYKQKLGESEKITKEAWDNLRSSNDPKAAFHGSDDKSDISPSENEHATHESSNGDPLRVIEKSSPTSISPTILTTGVSLFSPKQKPTTPRSRPGSVDLFSYDSEIPRLETELHERQCKIDSLEREMKSLKGDLAVARESTQSMVQTLEEATRELNTLRDSKDRSAADMKQQRILSDKLSETLRAELLSSEKNLQELQACHGSQCSDRINELDTQLQAARQELESVQSEAKRNTSDTHQVEDFQSTVVNFEKEILEMRADKKQSEKKIDTLNNLVVTLRSQLTEIVEQKSQESAYLNAKIEKLQLTPKKATQSSPNAQAEGNSEEMSTQGSQSTRNEPMANQGTSNASKKKNKKKRKGNSSLEQHKEIQPEPGRAPQTSEKGIDEAVRSGTVIKLEEELRQLRILLEEKDAAIERIHGKLKDQEGLREEIDTLRDDLVNVGQEHVESKDRVKELVSEKTTLESTVANLEGELAELRSFHASITAGSEQKHKDLEVQLEDLKIKANALQIDLSAAQHLASSRFKDLKDLRNVLQKVQPEINTLRSEAAEMKGVKEALEKKDAEFKRLDSKHEEMRSEVARLKQIVTDREFENRALNQKMNQEISSRLKAEDAVSNSVQEIQRLEIERRQATESLDRMSRDLAKAREELIASKIRLRELDQQLSKSGCDNEALKEEIDLKTAQYASAQSLMASMRDQTAEMAMQTKEARERCEGLDEEVADAHRLLSERSREGETMRRLLADVEGRADARTREMKERMDIAIEERDRAEEEASTAGRRRARDLEDLKTKYRDIEISLKRAEEDKEELITAQRDWKRGREELEDRAGQSTKEVYEVRKAMDELRDALDERERQAWELEKEKAELRRSVEETQHRLEKLQKSNKLMADEIGKIQSAKTKARDSDTQSSRSSLDSAARLGSPAAKSRKPSAALMHGPNGQGPGSIDLVYLKNVLLQFLEQRDKKHQMQLIPVLGMLLHFDRKEEQKWMSAITTKS